MSHKAADGPGRACGRRRAGPPAVVLLCVAAAAFAAAMLPGAQACSDLLLANAAIYPNAVSARTLDLPPQPVLKWTIVAAPKGTPLIFHSVGPNANCSRAPLSGRPSQYGFQCIGAGREIVAGFAARTCPIDSAMRPTRKFVDFYAGICTDGINEKGLSTAMLIDGDAEPLPLAPTGSAPALHEFDLGTYLLANFATVREVKEWLRPEAGKVQLVRGGIARDALDEIGGVLAAWAFHFAVHDAAGESLVVEFRKGSWDLLDNQLGVLTNAPGLPQQRESLAKWRSARVADHGGSLGGLMTPGNCGHDQAVAALAAGKPRQCSPLSRFITLAQNKEALFTRPWSKAGPVTPEGAAGNPDPTFGALAAASHLLNTVTVPGFWPTAAEQQSAGGTVWFNGDEQTLWSVLRDHTEGALYVQTASAPRWVKLPLARVLKGAARRVRARALADVVAPVMSGWALDRTAAIRGNDLQWRR